MTGYRKILQHLRDHADRADSQGFAFSMPSETELMQWYSCSRTTARRAYALLHAEGRVVTVPGRGRFLVDRDGNAVKGDAMYEKMAAELRRGIATGELPEGEHLVSPAWIARRHGTSRETARRAYELLEDAGYLTLDGRRWFVRDGAYALAQTSGPLRAP